MKSLTGIQQGRGSTVNLFISTILCILLLQWYMCQIAMGAEIIITPICDIHEEFNDNIYLSANSKISDYITTVTPSFSLSRNTERLTSNVLASFDWYTYARNDSLGSHDYSYQGQAAYQLSLRDNIGVSASYSYLSRPDSINQLTGLASSMGSDIYNYAANAGRALDATTSATVNYSFLRQTYENPMLLNNTTHNAGLGLLKNLSAVLPLLKGNINVLYSRADYRDSSSDNYSLSLGLGRNINEKFTWSLSAGGRLTHSSFSVLSQSFTVIQESNDNWGWTGSAGLSYASEKNQGSFSISRNFANASGQVGATENTAIALALGRNFTRNLTGQLSASYNLYQSSTNQFASSGTDDKIYQLGADVRYKLSDYFDLGLHFSYYTDFLGNSSAQITQNRVLLSLTSHGKFRLIGTNTLINEVMHGSR